MAASYIDQTKFFRYKYDESNIHKRVSGENNEAASQRYLIALQVPE